MSRDDLQTSVNGETWSLICPFMKIIKANISSKANMPKVERLLPAETSKILILL